MYYTDWVDLWVEHTVVYRHYGTYHHTWYHQGEWAIEWLVAMWDEIGLDVCWYTGTIIVGIG